MGKTVKCGRFGCGCQNRTMPIFELVHGKDHPKYQPVVVRKPSFSRSFLIGEYLPENVVNALEAIQ